MSIGIPAMFMMLFDGFVFEIMILMSGFDGNDSQAAQIIIMQLVVFNVLIIIGFENSVCTLLGWSIGANDYENTKKVISYHHYIIWIIMLISCTINFLLYEIFIKFIRNDDLILKKLIEIKYLVIIQLFFDGSKIVTRGMIRAFGLQNIGLYCNLIGHLLINLSLQI